MLKKKPRKYLRGERDTAGTMKRGNNRKSEQLLHIHTPKGEKNKAREKIKKKNGGSDCALKRSCRGGVCLDVRLTSSAVYVERDISGKCW